MSMSNNPPQLQLSLGHQTFKRSFHQFGLDVDDAEDSEAGAASSNSSASSGSQSGSANGSIHGISGSRSVSSGSSYSSPGGDVYGYNDGERSERNKRARSEGPEGTNMSAASSAASLEESSLLSFPTTSSGSEATTNIPQSLLQGHDIPRPLTESGSSSHHLSNGGAAPSFTLPELSFGPSTPSVAEFVALHSSVSNARTPEQPPGFAGMLSPRSSSPAPPPLEVVDVPMHDPDDELFGLSDIPAGHQSSSSNALLDTARSDALLNSATEHLRSAMERARTFDRMLAPLRSDTTNGPGESSQGPFRPRLPSFDFEARRRVSSPPAYAGENTNSSATTANLLNRNYTQPFTTSATASGYSARRSSTPARRNTSTILRASRNRSPSSELFHDVLRTYGLEDDGLFDEEDDLIVDSELAVDFNQYNARRPVTIDASSSGSESRSSLSNRDSSMEDTGRRDVFSRALDDRVRAINSLTDRTIDDLTSFISTSETEDDTRLSPLFDNSHLGTHFGIEPANEGDGIRSAARVQPNVPVSPSPPVTSDNSVSGFYGLGSPGRSISHSNTLQNQVRDRIQVNRSRANTDQSREWPGPPPSASSPVDLAPIPGLESRSRSDASRPRPHSPVFQFPLSVRSRPTPVSPDTDSEMRRIGSMVQLDMETDVRRRFEDNVLRQAREGNDGSSQLRSFAAQRSSPARQSSRPSLPTLRSALLGPLRGQESLRGLLAEERERNGNAGTTYGSASAVSPSMSGSGLRSRASHSEHPSARSSWHEFEGWTPERFLYGQHEPTNAILERRRLEAMDSTNSFTSSQPLPSGSDRYGWLRPPRINEDASTREESGNLAPSRLSPQTTQARDALRETSERRSLLESWFPPIHEEDRLREAERTRLREMRERHRLPIRSRSSLIDQLEYLAPSGERPDLVRWANSWDETRLSAAPSAETGLFGPMNEHIRPEVGSGISVGNEAPSSTEAAAFFASGPSYGPSRQSQNRPSPAALRQRRLRLLSGLEDNERSSSLFQPWLDFELSMTPAEAYDFGRELRRSPSPNSRPGRIPDTSEDILRMQYLNRRLQMPMPDTGENSLAMEYLNRGGQRTNSPRRHPSSDTNNVAPLPTGSDNVNFNDHSPMEVSRVRAWNPQIPSRPVQDSGSLQRSTSLRSNARPPSLPPLRFDRLSSTGIDELESAESRFLGSEGSAVPRLAPWRRANARFDGYSELPESNSTARSTLQRNEDLAMHRAMVLRSVQAQQTVSHESEQERQRPSAIPAASAPSSGRLHGFRHAMDVHGVDGLTSLRRQQLSGAFERERERERERTRPTRTETHVRWGEITDDDADARPSAHSPRSWAESFRSRRRSTSALFAPPPENADNVPPNRARGTGTAAADPTTQAQAAAPFDWFSMVSSNRARARHRARLGRPDEEPASRSFFRFGRSRPGLRNIGDFVRDEDFDTSYEGLLALTATIGDVKPRATPPHVLNALPNGLYKDWQSPGCDTRCPICLDDYKSVDPLLKAEPCNHWCHKECLEQWLHTAQTCPVCRTKIRPSQRAASPPPVAGPSRINHNESSEDVGDDSDDDLSFLSSSPGHLDRALFDVLSSSNSFSQSPPPPP